MISYISNKLKELYVKKLDKDEEKEKEMEKKENDSIKNYIKTADDVFKDSSRWDDDKEWVYSIDPSSRGDFNINTEDIVEADNKLDRYSNRMSSGTVITSNCYNPNPVCSNIVYSNQQGIVGSAGYSGIYGTSGQAGILGGSSWFSNNSDKLSSNSSQTKIYSNSSSNKIYYGSNDAYSTYLIDKSNQSIKYSEYIAEQLNNSFKNIKKINRIVSEVDPYGEENWDE